MVVVVDGFSRLVGIVEVAVAVSVKFKFQEVVVISSVVPVICSGSNLKEITE